MVGVHQVKEGIMVKISYERAMDKTFMIVEEWKVNSRDAYEYRMLENNPIDHILPLELHHVNDTSYYYYDITTLSSLKELNCNKPFTYLDVTTYIKGIIEALISSKPYLLKEDNFIMTPDTIYVSPVEGKIKLTYMIGYGVPMKEQFSGLMEAILKYIDYKDERAIVLTYNLYLASKEDTCTYEHLLSFINKGDMVDPVHKIGEIDGLLSEKSGQRKGIDNISKGAMPPRALEEKRQEGRNINRITPPVIEERIEGEKEVLQYYKKVYLWLSVMIVAGLVISLLMFQTSILKSKLGGKYDIAKVSCFVFLLLSIEIYVGSKVFGKNQKVVSIQSTFHYEDVSYEEETILEYQDSKVEKDKLESHELDNDKLDITECLTVEEEEYTQVLNPMECKVSLIPLEQENSNNILLIKFPFSIGKKKLVTDYMLDSKVISRVHAKILKENEEYYIMDLQSTNGTYVNGTKIDPLGKVSIRQGDKISFADLHYKFSVF